MTEEFFGFEFQDQHVVNPTASECGRFTVSPEYYGFSIVQLGDNRTGWRRDGEDGTYLLLTDVDNASHVLGGDCTPFVLSVYQGDDDVVGVHYEMEVGVVVDADDDLRPHFRRG